MGRQASKRFRHRAQSCSRKQAYGRVEADRQAVLRGMDSYRCSVCRSWHLTKRKIPTETPEAKP